MTRRLTLAIVSVVVGALLVAGLGTLLLVRVGSRDETRRRLVDQADTIATRLDIAERPALLRAIASTLRLEDVGLVRFGPRGRTIDAPPAGVSLADLDFARLRAGETLAGSHGGIVFAAAPLNRPAGLAAIVLTRRADAGLRTGGRWFVLATLLALAASVAVAFSLGSRLTRPLRDAEAATRRIAAGDLSARVPVPDNDDELAVLARSINAMATELDRSRGLERQFLLSVSHDLRTPLTSIRGFAEAISDGAAPDHTKAAAVIAAEARRLERLVGDLLALARLDARRFALEPRPVDVGELVVDAAEGFRPAAEDAGIALAVARDREGLRTAADADRLAQVVANLVENALKFATSRIAVGAHLSSGDIEISVEDDGPGIADDDLPRVFDRLYTSARPPARNGTGSGLGLAIVRELVQAMGGAVRAERVAPGTRMVVSLPAATSAS